ncbi:hypothetical protein [Sphingomonas sp. PAMC 26621]|nr:hypothetical protein [Sphingomonas sp. PAMC 26621]
MLQLEHRVLGALTEKLLQRELIETFIEECWSEQEKARVVATAECAKS